MSARESLVTYLREKAHTTSPDQVDWDARRKKYLQEISALYRLIKTWLAQLEKEGSVTFHESQSVIEEDLIGLYKVKVLDLFVGKQRVSFAPMGLRVVGAEGRIDVKGQKDSVTLALVKGKWHILQRTPEPKLVAFTEESFRNLLESVLE